MFILRNQQNMIWVNSFNQKSKYLKEIIYREVQYVVMSCQVSVPLRVSEWYFISDRIYCEELKNSSVRKQTLVKKFFLPKNPSAIQVQKLT